MPVKTKPRPSKRLPLKVKRQLRKIDNFISDVEEFRAYLKDSLDFLSEMHLSFDKAGEQMGSAALEFMGRLDEYIDNYKENPVKEEWSALQPLIERELTEELLLTIRGITRSLSNKLIAYFKVLKKKTIPMSQLLAAKKLSIQADRLLEACVKTVETPRLGAFVRGIDSRVKDIVHKFLRDIADRAITDTRYVHLLSGMLTNIKLAARNLAFQISQRKTEIRTTLSQQLEAFAEKLWEAQQAIKAAAKIAA